MSLLDEIDLEEINKALKNDDDVSRTTAEEKKRVDVEKVYELMKKLKEDNSKPKEEAPEQTQSKHTVYHIHANVYIMAHRQKYYKRTFYVVLALLSTNFTGKFVAGISRDQHINKQASTQ